MKAREPLWDDVGLRAYRALDRNIWEFPKIGDPQYSTLNSRIVIIRTPK